MAPSVRVLGLYDLLAPEFLAGFSFPSYIDQYLSLLAVSNLTMTSDDSGVLYTGTVYFPTGLGNPAPVTQHTDPSGAIFEWSDINFQFRLRAWRAGSGDVQTVVNAISSGSNSLETLFNNFGSAGSNSGGSDYPGLQFRLELLLSVLTFHLGSDWVPGTMDSTYHVVPDTTASSKDVRVLLPKMLFRYEQPQDFSQAPTFTLDSWGSEGFDAPSDLDEGQLVTMDPPLALHTSGRVAFSVQDIVLDLSQNDTPPEIMSHFGIGDDFTGIYIKALQFYYSDSDKDFAFNISVTDAVISFQGKVWLEAELDLLFDSATHPDSTLIVTVKFLNGSQPIQFNPSTPVSGQKGAFQGGSVAAPANVYIQLQVSGAIPPYTYAVDFTPSGGSVVHMWDTSKNQAYFQTPPTTDQSGTLVITVTDSTKPTAVTLTDTMSMKVSAPQSALPNGAPQDSSANSGLAPATPTWDARPSGIPDSYQISFTPSTSGDVETLIVQGGPDPVTATAGGNSVAVSSSRQVLVEVPAGKSVSFAITYPAQGDMPNEFDLLFSYDGPGDSSVSSYVINNPSPADPVFSGNAVPAGVPGDGLNHSGADAVSYWVKNALDLTQSVSIEGRASYEGKQDPTTVQHNQSLSDRRLQVAQQVAAAAGATIGATSATGQSVAQGANRSADPSDRVAILTGTAKPGQPTYTLSGTLTRAASPTQPTTPTTPAAPKSPATPPAASNSKKPPSLKRLSFRVRLEKNIPVLMEISGEIDFQQQTQTALQQAPGSDPNGNLGLTNTANATANKKAGPTIVDFTLNVTYDTATNNLTETLTLGSAPADQNGLLQMQNGPAGSYNTFKNIFGAVLVFTPILNAATMALDPNSAGEWSDLAISLAPPVLIGGLGWINTVSVTLFGGSLVVRENVPNGLSSTQFTAAALTFDYGVSFRFDINPLNIHSKRNLSVRYNAVGFSLNFIGDPAFKFVFDTSKGYTLDLSDPSLFNLPSPLGDLLKIAEARIAQHNPLTLEVDLVIKADLGVITVDQFQIKIPLDGSGPPMILPSGIHVNIPGAIKGGGSVHIEQGGFEGGFDLTLVPLQLRIAAQVGVQQVSDGARNATAFYLGMEVDFPTPIMLGTTGLGIFGFFGLFAMHYMRNLPAAVPGDAVGPDLQWLVNSGGQPQFLYNQSNPSVQNWVPQIDNWAIGIGALLGTVDGFLLNMRGMFVLTLPGPQIIITVNLQIVTDLPGGDNGIDTGSLTVGILGILDIDFNLGQITIGVSINLNIESLIVITIPISIFFSWNDPDTWHVWIGTIQTPISANILGIVKGSGYFMIGGQPINPFPPNSTSSLPGVAVAAGFSASIIWGSEDIGIYLEVVVGADLGVSFSPSLFIVGDIHLSGKLQLLIVSIGATGDFLVQAPNPFYLHVKVCGSVSFFFFSISACVEFSIGSQSSPLPPPPLISRMYLQSYAPVIPSGQGGSRPIDASLGDATETVTNQNVLSTLPPPATVPASDSPNYVQPVPIDTVPVLQFDYAADASAITATFTSAVPQCSVLPTSIGGNAVSLGGGRTAVYTLQQLTISPPLPSGDPPPPVVWRKNTSSNDNTATRVDLALFSRDPNIASHALERSTTLNGQLTSIWGGTCNPIAPPACVLWTFCGQLLGPALDGWNLVGIPTPDLPGTTRSSPVPTGMYVEGPSFINAKSLLAAFGPIFGGDAYQPARIIGLNYGGNFTAASNQRTRCFRALELPELIDSTDLKEIARSFLEGFAYSQSDVAARLKDLRAQLAKQQAEWRWVRLYTGASNQVSLYMALNPRLAHISYGTVFNQFGQVQQDALDNSLLKVANQLSTVESPATTIAQGAAQYSPLYDVIIRERDTSGTLLRESTLESLHPNIVIGTTGLPAEWIDPAGPWLGEIEQLVTFMDGWLQNLTKVFVRFTPLPQTTIVEIAEVGPALLDPPTVVIGAVESCPLSEEQRYELGLEVQQSQITTLEGYLDGGSPVPLLAPNTTYTVTVEYNVATTEADGTTVTNYNSVQQGFTFQTDAVPPDKLDPWVLSCSPANNELHIFYDDPVVVVFNDQEAIQLFNAYGYQLQLDLRAADGLNDPAKSVSNTTSVSGFGPAGYDSLLNLIQQGLLPCVGSTTAYQNQQFTADVQLRPCMAYTLDIVTDPAATPAPPAGQAVVPLYRTRFTTSKYPSLTALANELGGSRIRHNHLTGPLTLTVPTSGQANPAADQDIESAFQAAGEQALPAPSDNTVTIYWIPKGGSGPYIPYCILIDCTEPLWRVRQEPSLVPVDPSDPSFNIVQITPTTALEVREAGGSNIAGYLYSTSGTRTIAFFAASFSPPPGGAMVTLELHRPASTAFGLADSATTIVAVPIGPQAPWENDHV